MNADDIERTLRARATFDASVGHVDADTRRRLRDIRLHALRSEVPRQRMRWLVPGGAALAVAMVVAAVVVVPRLQHAQGAPVATPFVHAAPALPSDTAIADDAVALDPLEDADPDMVSDLDFYGWLAQQPGATGGGG